MPATISVKQLNSYVRSLLEGDSRLSFISVCGEISNFKNHYSSGHLYFSLKENDAVIKCVMFRSSAVALKFTPADGDKVICTGRVSVYERDGQYQFYVDSIVQNGQGDLGEQFRRIKEMLEKEGLFAPEYKRPLPKFPKSVAVVTSDTGAALQDIINIISRRFPLCEVVVSPALVQGSGAAESLINALQKVYSLGSADVIIIGRGGGSAEDLWEFNSEKLARVIYESPIPVISAVGHETDFTICDFVSDLRAPTPSAAAEIAVPDIADLFDAIDNIQARLKNGLLSYVNKAEMRLSKAYQSAFMLKPERIVDDRQIFVDRLSERLSTTAGKIMAASEKELASLTAKLDALSPLKVLSRGFTAVCGLHGTVTSVKQVSRGDKLNLRFSDGDAECEILSVNEE